MRSPTSPVPPGTTAATGYRELLQTPSLPWLLGTSTVGRFNQGMGGIAVMMLITQTSSYAVLSAVSAVSMGGSLLAGPLLSRWADLYGRRRVLAVSAILHACTLAALALAPPSPLMFVVVCLLSTLCAPPMTPAVRAALPALVKAEQHRSVFALEATIQELIVVIGPTATAVLAAAGGPELAVGVCAGLVVVGTLAYVSDSNVEAGRVHRDRVVPGVAGRTGHVLQLPGVRRVLLAGMLLTAALPSQVLGVIALVSGAHVSSTSGLVISCGSLGSLIGGLVYGSWARPRARLRHLLLYFAAGLAVLPLAPNTGLLAVLVFCWGMTVAPAMSRLSETLSSLLPARSSTEGFGWMSSAFAVGGGIGSTVAGLLITAWGGRSSIIAASCFALLAALAAGRDRSARRIPWPGRRRSTLRRGRTPDIDERKEVDDPK